MASHGVKARRILSACALVATTAVVFAAPASAGCLLGNSLCVGSTPPSGSSESTSPAPAPDFPHTVFGFSDTQGLNHDFPEDVFVNKMWDSGGRLHRIALNWQWHEQAPGQYSDGGSLAREDQLYADELNIGVRQIIQLFGSPPWAIVPGATTPDGTPLCVDPNSTCLAPPNMRDPVIAAEWENWVRFVVARYPEAKAIEVWNEPNLAWSWGISQDPQLYGLMVAATTRAAHAVDPSMPVLAGAVADYRGPDTPELTDFRDMLRSVYSVAGRSGFDAISYHSYPCDHLDPLYHMQTALDRLRNLKAELGDPARPLWMTETGATTSGPTPANCDTSFSEDQQGPVLEQVIEWAKHRQADAGDLPIVMINALFNGAPRDWINRESPSGRKEYGLIAWDYDALGSFRQQAKPGYTDVRCKLKGWC
jgi:hypothetical protein